MRKCQRAFLFAVFIIAGCASGRGAGEGNNSVITAEQMRTARVRNAHDAVSTLKPDWLSSRGPTSVTNPRPTGVSVYVNGMQMGGADALRSIDVDNIVEIRYYAAGPASARFGMGHPRGVIEVVTRTN